MRLLRVGQRGGRARLRRGVGIGPACFGVRGYICLEKYSDCPCIIYGLPYNYRCRKEETKLDDFIKDLLVTTYGAVLAVALQELVEWLKKKTRR